jgi:hypothetical protein
MLTVLALKVKYKLDSVDLVHMSVEQNLSLWQPVRKVFRYLRTLMREHKSLP